jgi:transposase
MSGAGYSTYDIRLRAVQAIVEERMPITTVADAFRTDRTTVHRWLARYREEGDAGLHRRPVSGRPRKLQSVGRDALKAIVMAPASEYGFETDFWTTRRLIQVFQSELAITVSKQTVMRRLHEAGLTYQKPEREYFELTEEDRQKWVREEVPKIRAAVREHRAILYFQDEANISLTALLAKTWAPCGKTPKQKVTAHRGGVSAQSAITKSGQLIFRLHDKRITSQEVIDFLSQMLRHHPRRHLVVVMDNARPHTSQQTMAYIQSQPRLHVFNLPAYSPDWNPDEKVWNHLKHQELKGHQAKTKAELRVLTEHKLKEMSHDPSLLRGIFFRCCMAELLD